MKKLFISSILIFVSLFNIYSFHEKYTQGYNMMPSAVNTESNETGLSFFKDKVVFSVTDGSETKLYSGIINEGIIDLEEIQEEPDMTALKIFGTFAYDESINKIYFSRYNKGTKNYMLYESTLNDSKWSKPKKMKIKGLAGYMKDGSTLVNAGWLYRAPGFSGFFNPTLADEGKRIYFSGNFSTGEGDRDIWYIDFDKNNKWDMPKNAGLSINTEGKEDYPFVSGDSLLYFASTTDSEGGLDLYVSKKEDGEWQPATSLGAVYNSSDDDFNIIGDERGLFFISSRNSDNGDDIYRPNRMLIEMTTVMDEPQPEAEPFILLKTFPWKLFYFDFDKDVLNEEFLKEMDELFVTMQDYIQDHTFVIRGHTDERGSDAYNDRLSYNRAKRIYNMLVQRGIPADMMKIEAYGESQPVIPNAKTEEEHAQNRRVEVDVLRK